MMADFALFQVDGGVVPRLLEPAAEGPVLPPLPAPTTAKPPLLPPRESSPTAPAFARSGA